jgi:Matrixin
LKQEIVIDLISQKTLLEEINTIRKRQVCEFATKTSKLECEVSEKNEIIDELREDKQVLLAVVKREPKESKNIRNIIGITILVASLSIFISHAPSDLLSNHNSIFTPLKTEYLIQNLQGNTVATWKAWHLADGQVLKVNIVDANAVSKDKLDAIKGAILDEQTVQIDDSLLNKGPAGSSSTYYLGWQGALEHTSQTATQYHIPVKFNIIESPSGEGDIIINLSSLENADGYTGYTRSDTDGNQLLKSYITIFDVNQLSAQGLAAITRHEFGHALGLAHSTDPQDLMHATIQTNYPFISECDTDAIKDLYNGGDSGSAVCANIISPTSQPQM